MWLAYVSFVILEEIAISVGTPAGVIIALGSAKPASCLYLPAKLQAPCIARFKTFCTHMLTTSQVAAKANVAPNTVRNYVREYADLFSEAARGLQGNRQFDEDDVQTLCSLVALKTSGMPLAEAADRLRSQATPPVIDVAATQASPSLQEAQEATFAVQRIESSVQPQIEALRLEIALLHAQQKTGMSLFVTGVIVGAAVVLVVVALVLAMQ